MHFDGGLRNTEFPRDDLIGCIKRRTHDDFLFARSQIVKYRSVFRRFFVALSFSQGRVNRLLNNLKKIKGFDRFFQKTHGTALHGANRHRNVTVSGQENNGKLAPSFDKYAMHLHAGEPFHAHIKNDAAGAFEIRFLKKVLAAFVTLHFPATRFQQHHLGNAKQFIVINQSDQRHVCCHFDSLMSFCSACDSSVPGTDSSAASFPASSVRRTIKPPFSPFLNSNSAP